MISGTVIIILLTVLLVCLVFGVPIAFSLGLAGAATIVAASGIPFLIQVPLTLQRTLADPVMLAVPMYILMGEILYRGKVGQQLFEVANVWVGRMRGGTGVSAVSAFTFFAAIVGSSMASVLTIGRIALPEMEKAGYSKRLSYGLSAVGGSLGILIPPSIPLIIYASLASVSPAQLFIAGLLPGILIAALLAAWAMFAAPPTRDMNTAAWSARKALRTTWRALPDLSLPVIVLGGIYTGIYTPTEAAGIGVILSLLLTVVLRRSLSLKDLPGVLIVATRHSASLLAIVAGALILGSALTLIGLPQFLAKTVMEAGVEPWVVLLIMMVTWTILGFFLEVISIILITVPVFVPIAVALGFDPLWFGILMVLNMELAVITPPLGMNLFALKAILPDEKIEVIIRATLPSLAIVLTVLVLVWIFPDIALILTRF
ncbi:TRAP transporter large permease [Pontivivens nitratireducens]|uniref:TRAP transporter large permease protein n=1 Tax=Pontivivens nitratireducens TaxID=2758038 RepID=A0A6G7VQQ5_9RHOB|nr:TRAP transporter large permease subunit [Pontibrevibacter nitratireducens]QIK42216.1 TRAP transporter large permease subunit [Pontibrevibacter nitratireducens]